LRALASQFLTARVALPQAFKIPKKHVDPLPPAAAFPPAFAAAGGGFAGGAMHAAGTGPTLASWRRKGAKASVVKVSGLPPSMSHAEWKDALRLAGVSCEDTALGGWALPGAMWRCSGVGYLLVSAKEAGAAAQRLGAMSLRCPSGQGVRPLFAEECKLEQLEPRDEPLVGHLQLGDGATRGRDPIVPHFVQSNTLELDMSLQWRTLVRRQLQARKELHTGHVTTLAAVLHGGAARPHTK
jgi:hypothetical protein